MPRRRVLASFAIALFICAAATAQTTKVYKPGNGVSLPVVVHEVKPEYTREAMQQQIQGSVFMLVVVLDSGDVGDVQISKSLDAEYGLDQAAITAAKQWKFKPGTREGTPVAVEVTLQMTFTLK